MTHGHTGEENWKEQNDIDRTESKPFDVLNRLDFNFINFNRKDVISTINQKTSYKIEFMPMRHKRQHVLVVAMVWTSDSEGIIIRKQQRKEHQNPRCDNHLNETSWSMTTGLGFCEAAIRHTDRHNGSRCQPMKAAHTISSSSSSQFFFLALMNKPLFLMKNASLPCLTWSHTRSTTIVLNF